MSQSMRAVEHDSTEEAVIRKPQVLVETIPLPLRIRTENSTSRKLNSSALARDPGSYNTNHNLGEPYVAAGKARR